MNVIIVLIKLRNFQNIICIIESQVFNVCSICPSRYIKLSKQMLLLSQKHTHILVFAFASLWIHARMLTNYVIKILNYNYANNAAINGEAATALTLVYTSTYPTRNCWWLSNTLTFFMSVVTDRLLVNWRVIVKQRHLRFILHTCVRMK